MAQRVLKSDAAGDAGIVRSLVERVVVGPAGADIRLRLDGLCGLVRDSQPSRPLP